MVESPTIPSPVSLRLPWPLTQVVVDPSAEIYDDEVVEVDDDVTPFFINRHVHSFHSFPSILFSFLALVHLLGWRVGLAHSFVAVFKSPAPLQTDSLSTKEVAGVSFTRGDILGDRLPQTSGLAF